VKLDLEQRKLSLSSMGGVRIFLKKRPQVPMKYWKKVVASVEWGGGNFQEKKIFRKKTVSPVGEKTIH